MLDQVCRASPDPAGAGVYADVVCGMTSPASCRGILRTLTVDTSEDPLTNGWVLSDSCRMSVAGDNTDTGQVSDACRCSPALLQPGGEHVTNAVNCSELEATGSASRVHAQAQRHAGIRTVYVTPSAVGMDWLR